MAKKSGKLRLPEKRSMNLYVPEGGQDSKSEIKKLLLRAFIILFVLVGVFGRYGMMFWNKHKLASEKEQLAQVESQLVNYDTTKVEYDKYTRGFMTGEEKALEARRNFIIAANQAVRGNGTITNIVIADNNASITVDVNSLNNVAQIRRALRANPSVNDVTVYTADTSTTEGINGGKTKNAVTTINFTMGQEMDLEG